MDSARLAIATFATLGAGVGLGLAASPTLRTYPELDWRSRYHAAVQEDPAPLPGVAYYGDGSTAWAFGGVPRRFADRVPPPRVPDGWAQVAAYVPPPFTFDADPLPEPVPAQLQAEMTAAQAAVAGALARSAAPAPDDTTRGETARSETAAASAESGADQAAAPEDPSPGAGRVDPGPA